MHRSPSQGGFTLLELMVVMAIMLTIMVLVMRYMNDSIKISTVTNEMTEAQQNLRTAQDFIARDLLAAGDGMQDIKSPRLTKTFLNSYLTKAPVADTDATLGVLGVITSDDQVPASTAVPVPSPSPSTTLPVLAGTDRLTIMQMDPTFNGGATIPLAAGKITGNGLTVTLPSGTDMSQFNSGDIYFFTSANGSAFGTVTAVNAATGVLSFAAGDTYTLNQNVSTGPLNLVGGSGTKAASMMRMLVVNYFVDSNELLHRRVFGVGGKVGFTDTVIAENVANLQIRYLLHQTDANGNVLAPAFVTQLASESQQGQVRLVEVTVTTETAHTVVNGGKQQMSMTGATSVRNLQFNTHLQPTN
jgi:prepilin-type N-terminal cleavage/methylation domain-containing protein